ncbi:protein FAM161A isoform X2 [Ceratina calcarata]|nr:protein FAM161A isoform X2 [Ceratina calcarata]XP_026674333.1 protein FAM161A isoform X2 [Ceratina calcarata]
MTEHKGMSFYNSCVKVPVDPYSRQPTPSYERMKSRRGERDKIHFVRNEESISDFESSSPREIVDDFLKFLGSIPDYGQVHHLSNEQFKREVDHLRRKQKLLLNNLENSLADHEDVSKFSVCKLNRESKKAKSKSSSTDELTLNGKKCYLEDCRATSPILVSSRLNRLAEDLDPPGTTRCDEREREDENQCKEKVYLINGRDWDVWDKLNNDDYIGSDIDTMETRSLPGNDSKEWHPTVPKPFTFTLREEADKYMRGGGGSGGGGGGETQEEDRRNFRNSKKSACKRRRVRPIPLTSKLPLYDRLLAQKEQRSRMIREESALNLMSQVRPFKLECDRRAWRSLARSSPELRGKTVETGVKFKAKPVPRNLFSTEVYDRMLEDEYYRQLQKKVRAAQLMKSSSLPPSMARRERAKSAFARTQGLTKRSNENTTNENTSPALDNDPVPLERCRSTMSSLIPVRGNNLAAILRCQVSREKLEREIREKMEEKRREQEAKIRECLVGRNPVWRALRSAARHEHERDISIRTSLRRDEAREQAERHRLQMEMMLDRVTQIPTLFERHSQKPPPPPLAQPQRKASDSKRLRRKKKEKHPGRASSSVELYMDDEHVSRSDSGSLTSSSGILVSASQSCTKSSSSSDTSTSTKNSEKSTIKPRWSASRSRLQRSQLKVSINETAELIEDRKDDEQGMRVGERSNSDDRNEDLRSVEDNSTR